MRQNAAAGEESAAEFYRPIRSTGIGEVVFRGSLPSVVAFGLDSLESHFGVGLPHYFPVLIPVYFQESALCER